MKKSLKILATFFLIGAFYLGAAPKVLACPLCTASVGVGLGISQYLGIDDAVSGVWIGGFLLSLSFWTSELLEKRKLNFKKQKLIITLLTFLLALVYFWTNGNLGHPFNTFLGVDKLGLGIVFGVGSFLLALKIDQKVRAVKGGQIISFQKVIFPISSLLLTSLLFYFLTKT